MLYVSNCNDTNSKKNIFPLKLLFPVFRSQIGPLLGVFRLYTWSPQRPEGLGRRWRERSREVDKKRDLDQKSYDSSFRTIERAHKRKIIFSLTSGPKGFEQTHLDKVLRCVNTLEVRKRERQDNRRQVVRCEDLSHCQCYHQKSGEPPRLVGSYPEPVRLN